MNDVFAVADRIAALYLGRTAAQVKASDITHAQIVELTNIIALENMRGRFNLALGIGSSGFREGLVCAVPDRAPAQDGSTARAGAAVGAAAGAGSVNTAA